VRDAPAIQVEVLDGSADFAELDRFASSVPYSSPFQAGFSARTYSRCSDAKPIVLAARNKGGLLVASIVGIVFSHGKRPGSIADRWSRHCTVRGTPLSLQDESSRSALRLLLAAIEGAVGSGTTYVRHYPDREGPFLKLLQEDGYVREDWLNFIVDLTETEEEILGRMSKPRRKVVRAGERSGLSIEEVGSQTDLDELYAILQEAHSRLRIPLQRRELFNAVLADLVPPKHAVMFLARQAGESLAARVVLVSKEIAYDWYAGSKSRAKPRHADELLAWASIRRAKALGASVFDFGGAGIPGETYGPREFKRRFGGQQTNFGRFTKVLHPSRLRLAKAAAGILRQLA
jgi:serine/alanine adding enzyme